MIGATLLNCHEGNKDGHELILKGGVATEIALYEQTQTRCVYCHENWHDIELPRGEIECETTKLILKRPVNKFPSKRYTQYLHFYIAGMLVGWYGCYRIVIRMSVTKFVQYVQSHW